VIVFVTAVLNERYSTDNQLHRRLQQRIHHSPHVYTELALTDTSTVLQVVTIITECIHFLTWLVSRHSRLFCKQVAQLFAKFRPTLKNWKLSSENWRVNVLLMWV